MNERKKRRVIFLLILCSLTTEMRKKNSEMRVSSACYSKYLDRHEPYCICMSTCSRQGSKKVTYRQGGIAVTRGLAKRLNSIHKGLITAHNMRTTHPEMKCLSRQGRARKSSSQSAQAHQATRLHRCYMSVDTRLLLADSRRLVLTIRRISSWIKLLLLLL